MEETDDVVREITQQCAARGVAVSEMLAAFIARTVIETQDTDLDPKVTFTMDSPLTPEGINSLIDRCVERVLEEDSPSLETIRMQVNFDMGYAQGEKSLQARAGRRAARLKEMQRGIVTVRCQDGADFQALTALHRQIFNFLLRYAHETTEVDRSVEREVGAALESVLPRISLKAFLALTSEQKYVQLEELASIVLGIRLFNRHIGKGGANLPDVEEQVTVLLAETFTELASEAAAMQTTCRRYQDDIVFAQMHELKGVTDQRLQRWKEELANRRQYLVYLQSLQEDVTIVKQKVEAIQERLAVAFADLRLLVGNRASIPKEHVYPKFDHVATEWQEMCGQLRLLRVRVASFSSLKQSRNAFTITLMEEEEMAGLRGKIPVSPMDEELEAAEAAVEQTESSQNSAGTGRVPPQKVNAVESPRGLSSVNHANGDLLKDANSNDTRVGPETSHADGAGGSGLANAENDGEDRPIKLSIESTPEFMQLPLEYQGFCPWTVVYRSGLLLPGRPELGVLRWRNAHYVFAHKVALTAFQRDPERVLSRLKAAAMRSPELIHLLRLEEAFPYTGIAKLLRSTALKGNSLLGGSSITTERQDASTSTPTHFNEKHIDQNYSWNQWTLRRKAVQIANLRKCTTTAQQTDDSHFRRDNTTQVWPPRAKATQTAVSSGTNPPRQVQYFAGLREAPADGNALSKFVKPSSDPALDAKPGVITLTFDLC